MLKRADLILSPDVEKHITPSYEGQWGPSYIPVHSRFFEKIASSSFIPDKILKIIETLKPRDDGRYIHLNAVGAQHAYGANANGDSFPRWSLLHEPPPDWALAILKDEKREIPEEYGHETFERYGYPFLMHCFPAGTPIMMADRQRVPIDEVAIGDLVMTMVGPRPVTKVFQRNYSGPGVSLSFRGQDDNLVGTKDHPVLVFRRGNIHCSHGYCRLAINDHHREDCREIREPVTPPEWLPLSAVLPGDYLVFPKPELGGASPGNDLAELVGWVASEGNLRDDGGFGFSFSAENERDIGAVIGCAERNGLKAGVTPRPQYGLTAVWFNSQAVANAVRQFVTGTFENKHLTSKIFDWSPDSVLQMLGSYIDGDGCVTESGRGEGQLRIRSSSRKMRYSLSDLIRALGVPCTNKEDAQERCFISPTNGKMYVGRPSGCVIVAASFSPEIARYSVKAHTKDMKNQVARMRWENLYLVRVEDKEEVMLDELVYNLEVEEAHHYIASDVVVHNCNKDPMLSIGERVCCSAYNEPMERVELIVFISKDKAPDLVQRIDSGEHVPWSMGTKVPWDRCSYCGHISKTRADYCEHLQTLMNVILPDGRRVMAENWFPRFFDISSVITPAWRPAMSLRKVAGMNLIADPTAVTRAREHAPFPIDIQKIASAQEVFKRASIKTSDIMKNVPLKAEPPIAGLTIKPELLEKIRGIVEKDIATRRSIPTATMNALRQDFSPMDLVNGMTSAGILMDGNDLNSLTGGNAANLPDRLDLSNVPSRLLMRLRNLVGGWSMFDQPLANRAVRVIRITVAPRPGLEKMSSAVAGKYRKLLEELPVDELIKAASRVELLMVVDPHAVEDSIVGGRTTDDRIQPVLPFVVGVRLSLDH